MEYNIYLCEYKGETYLQVASDLFIEKKLTKGNSFSEFQLYLQRNDPKDYNLFKAEILDINRLASMKELSIVFQDISIKDFILLYDLISSLSFSKIVLHNSEIEINQFQNFKSVKRITFGNSSICNLNLAELPNLEEISILSYKSSKVKLINDNSCLKSIVVWYYNPKSKNLLDLFHGLKNVQHLELNSTNIESIDGIEKMELLKSIQINYGRNLRSVVAINSNKFIENIHFNNCNKIDDFEKLIKRNNLIIRNTKLPG